MRGADDSVYQGRGGGRRLSVTHIWKVVSQLSFLFLKSTCSLSFSPFTHTRSAPIQCLLDPNFSGL